MNTVAIPDTNVILRYLLADNEALYVRTKPFFHSLMAGRRKAIFLTEVLLEAFYVLTKVYQIPQHEAAVALKELLSYRGVINRDKSILIEGFEMFLNSSGLSLLDCLICVKSIKSKSQLLTFDEKLRGKCAGAVAPEMIEG